jgi:ATP-dependent RNA helicase DeaD
LAAGELAFMQNLVEQYQQEHDVPALDIASALAKLAIGDSPLLLKNEKERPPRRSERGPVERRGLEPRQRRAPRGGSDENEFETFRVEVGHEHGTKPGNIVGALANEAGLGSNSIGRVVIEDTYSTVELPVGMPDDLFRDLQKVWVSGQTLKISRLDGEQSGSSERSERPVQRRKHESQSGPNKDHKSTGQAKSKKAKGVKKNKKGKRKDAKQ